MTPLKSILFVTACFSLTRASLFAQATESPDTVPRGKFLVEMDALNFTVDREGGGKYTAWAVGTTFLTTGLTPNWDLQVGADVYVNQKIDSAELQERESGFGHAYLRSKFVVWRETEWDLALAVLPYVKFPTGDHGVTGNEVEGGLIVPFKASLLGGFDLNAHAQVDVVRSPSDDGYDTAWTGSAVVLRELVLNLSVYGEAFATRVSGGEGTQTSLGAGVRWAWSDDFTWDLASYRGVSDAASDWNHVLRLEWMF